VRNVEVLMGLGGPRIMNTTGRASQVRSYLRTVGFDLREARSVNGRGVFEYVVEQVKG
jgi:hypothetical protein